MNRKKILLIIALITLCFSLYSQFEFFPDNQANYSTRSHSTLYIPLLNDYACFSNSILDWNKLDIFTKDHFITEDEKEILTKDDLRLNLNYKILLFRTGIRNYDVSFASYGIAKINLLDKQYTDLVLNGNAQDEYVAESLKDSEILGFSKLNFQYSITKQQKIKNIPVYFGVNMALYFPNFYGNVPVSTQEFGSTYEMSYYRYKLHYHYTDEFPKQNLGIGLGFGFRTELEKVKLYFSLDDIFANMHFSNMKSAVYEEIYEDSLLYFDTDYEAFQEKVENDSLLIDKTVFLSPSVELGGTYELSNKFLLALKYHYSDYSFPNGFSLGIGYKYKDEQPINFTIGKDDNVYYNIKLGFNYKRYTFLLGFTYFDGFFNGSNGLGLQIGFVKNFHLD